VGGWWGGIYPPTEGCYYRTSSMWGGMEKIVKVRGDPYVFFIWESGTKMCSFEAISQKISFDGWLFSVSQRLLQIRPTPPTLTEVGKMGDFFVNPPPSQEKNGKKAALGKKYNVTHPEITDGRNSKAVA
jgi:hypothetical protein